MIREREGLSLLEVLIAVAVIAVAFVALTASQVLNLGVTRDSQLASDATQIANSTLERLAQTILDDFSAYADCPTTGTCDGSSTEDAFQVDYAVARDTSSYVSEGLVRIDVDVSGPADVSLSHFISCMDVDPPPSVAHPGFCDE